MVAPTSWQFILNGRDVIFMSPRPRQPRFGFGGFGCEREGPNRGPEPQLRAEVDFSQSARSRSTRLEKG